MPPILAGKHLFLLLDEIGYCKATGFGAVGIDFCEIEAFCRATDTNLSWYEALMLHATSAAYAAQMNSKESSAPYQGEFKLKPFSAIKDKFKKR